ncbi:MAG: hypothetical protein ACQKBY_06350 [Verrucomicrobiales bacterium]
MAYNPNTDTSLAFDWNTGKLYTVGSNNGAVLETHETSDFYRHGGDLTDYSVVTIPEPSISLCSLASLTLLLRRRRR